MLNMKKKCVRCGTSLLMGVWGKNIPSEKNNICKECDIKKKRKIRLKKLALKSAKNALKHYNKTKDGYVYIITNPAWADWIKIGMAVDAEDRCKSFQTSSPHRDYSLEYWGYFSNRRKAEKKVHNKVAKIATGVSAEWFKAPVIDAIKIIERIMYD